MFETSDLNTIKTLLANKPESVRLLEVDDNSISKRIKEIKKIALKKKLKIEIKKFKNPDKKINLIFKPSEPKNIEYLEKLSENNQPVSDSVEQEKVAQEKIIENYQTVCDTVDQKKKSR